MPLQLGVHVRSIQVPPELYRTYTGNGWCDTLPLLTMAFSLPTLYLYFKGRRYMNLALFSVGGLLAVVYHICHLDPRGLHTSRILGVTGPVWRSWDILFAQWLLGRTVGQVVGAQHPLIICIANGVYPAALIHVFGQAYHPSLTAVSKPLVLVTVATLGCKLLIEGRRSWPAGLASKGGIRALVFFIAAFICFPMPALRPQQYYLYHSLWHVFCSIGYWELYCCLDSRPAYPILHRKARLSKRHHGLTEAPRKAVH